MQTTTDKLVELITIQTQKANAGDYSPLSKDDSAFLRAHLPALVSVPLQGCSHKLVNSVGTHIANGYSRIVVGDFGIYVELASDEINHANIVPKWPGKPSRPVAYIWFITKDNAQTKIYHQQRGVRYADYVAGMYYVSYFDVEFRA